MPKSYYHTKQYKKAGSVETMLQEMTENSASDRYKTMINVNDKTHIDKIKVKNIKKLFSAF